MNQFEFWTIAYRKRRGQETLLENTETPFTIVPNTWRYWGGDPFVIEREGVTYLFAELYDRILRRGVIGFCTVTDSLVTPWKRAIKMPHHLSYPNVFEKDGEIYMIPESYVANEIALYRAVRFPDKWEKVKTLADVCAVDSTVVLVNGKKYLIAQELLGNHTQLVRMTVNEDFYLSEKKNLSNTDDDNVRPGGNFFVHNGKQYRPSQDCSNGYGCALNLNEVNFTSEGEFSESLSKKISPDAITSNLSSAPKGIHTYNFTDQYEVIDLKGYETDYFFPIMRIFWGVLRRIKGLFGV